MVLRLPDISKSGWLACILEDNIINKMILTNVASSLKHRIKFNGEKQKALQLNRNKASTCEMPITGEHPKAFLVNQDWYESAMSYCQENKHHAGIYKQKSPMQDT